MFELSCLSSCLLVSGISKILKCEEANLVMGLSNCPGISKILNFLSIELPFFDYSDRCVGYGRCMLAFMDAYAMLMLAIFP